jgi:hypothetical protein
MRCRVVIDVSGVAVTTLQASWGITFLRTEKPALGWLSIQNLERL